MTEKWQQCELQSDTTHLVCMLPAGLLKIGYEITLKDDIDPNRRWTVLMLGSPVSTAYLHRIWNNNI